jgi:hypothetical protein
VIIPPNDTHGNAAFTQRDIAFISNIFATCLRHDFGYGLRPSAAEGPSTATPLRSPDQPRDLA